MEIRETKDLNELIDMIKESGYHINSNSMKIIYNTKFKIPQDIYLTLHSLKCHDLQESIRKRTEN